MRSEEIRAKKVKIRLHEFREAVDADELVKFFARRKGKIKVEVTVDLFTIYVIYDECLKSPGQIVADLSSTRFAPESFTILNG